MPGTIITRPVPNLGHPVNVGKVSWWLADAQTGGLQDIIGQCSVRASRSTQPHFGGPACPGQIGPAVQPSGSVFTSQADNNYGPVSNLANGAAGFSFAAWVYPSGTTGGVIACKGTAATTGNGTGWAIRFNGGAGQQFTFSVGRATANMTAKPNTGIVANQWTRIGVTFGSLNTSALTCYYNGVATAATLTAGSGALGLEGLGPVVLGVSQGAIVPWTGWMYDLALWNRALNPAEMYEEYLESVSGYPNAMLWPDALNGPSAAPAVSSWQPLGIKAFSFPTPDDFGSPPPRLSPVYLAQPAAGNDVIVKPRVDLPDPRPPEPQKGDVRRPMLFGLTPNPLPPGPGKGDKTPFVRRLPAGTSEDDKRRLERVHDQLSSLINSLIGQGIAVQLTPDKWTWRAGARVENRHPTAIDDATQGVVVGALWVCSTDSTRFICMDNTVNAAVWSSF